MDNTGWGYLLGVPILGLYPISCFQGSYHKVHGWRQLPGDTAALLGDTAAS